jgi:hypothetical protein
LFFVLSLSKTAKFARTKFYRSGGFCGAGVPAPRPPHAFALKLCPQEAGQSAVQSSF